MTLKAMIPSMLVRDLEASLAFYQRLGFRQTGCYPDGSTPTWLELSRDAVVLRLYTEPPRNTPAEPVFSGTLYIECDDVATLARRLQGAVDFAWGPETMDYGQLEFAVQDPDGYFIAFAQAA